MRRVPTAALASGWLAWLTFTAVAAAPPPSAFGRAPALEAVALSPDGALAAWIDNAPAKPLIEIFDLAKGETRSRIAAPDDAKLRGLQWSDDQTLLIRGSMTRGYEGSPVRFEWSRTVAMGIDGGDPRVLLHTNGPLSRVTGSHLLAPRTTTPKKVIMASWDFSAAGRRQQTGSRLAGGRKDEGWSFNLFEVDTSSGAGKLVSAGTPYTSDWVADARGQAVARGEWEAQHRLYTVLHRRGQGWAEILRLDTGEKPELLGLTHDGSALLIRAALHRPHVALWRLPFDGTAPQVALGDDDNDIVAAVRDPYSLEVLGGWRGGQQRDILWLDEFASSRAASLTKTFGGKHVAIVGRSADNTRALVAVGTHATPVLYYSVDFNKGTADIVGEAYPALAGTQLGTVRTVSYKARDGYEISAYLTLPPEPRDKNLALVVLPHDGPEAHDEPSFDWLAQFIATRGYAVLQPQFRGSTGHGEAHRKAGHRQWGGLMQDDVTDAVKAMIAEGIAEPQRVCIVGVSYGGYAALAGATLTPELYICAISVNGISDLPALISQKQRLNGEDSDTVLYWKDQFGSADLAARSPARNADRVRSSILLLHGVDDVVVPPEQSRLMAKALKGQIRPHQFIELPGEDHWLSRSDSRIRVLAEIEKFLADHLPRRSH